MTAPEPTPARHAELVAMLRRRRDEEKREYNRDWVALGQPELNDVIDALDRPAPEPAPGIETTCPKCEGRGIIPMPKVNEEMMGKTRQNILRGEYKTAKEIVAEMQDKGARGAHSEALGDAEHATELTPPIAGSTPVESIPPPPTVTAADLAASADFWGKKGFYQHERELRAGEAALRRVGELEQIATFAVSRFCDPHSLDTDTAAATLLALATTAGLAPPQQPGGPAADGWRKHD